MAALPLAWPPKNCVADLNVIAYAPVSIFCLSDRRSYELLTTK
jgi:hypothetical protein